jgi:hypothetical protein
MKSLVAFAVLALLAGCNTPTAAGTVLLTQKLDAAHGNVPAGSPEAAPKRIASKVRVANGAAEVEVRLDVVEIPAGKFLSGVEVAVTDNGGGELSAAMPPGASPINMGTTEAVLAAQQVMVEWHKKSLTGTNMSQTMIEVRGDGTANAR